MAGYVIVNNEVTDEALYGEFRELAAKSIKAHGGRYLVRGGATEVMEGEWAPDRVVVVEFESVEQARTWLTSPEYAEARNVRMKCAGASVVIVEGV